LYDVQFTIQYDTNKQLIQYKLLFEQYGLACLHPQEQFLPAMYIPNHPMRSGYTSRSSIGTDPSRDRAVTRMQTFKPQQGRAWSLRKKTKRKRKKRERERRKSLTQDDLHARRSRLKRLPRKSKRL
jgi:hypothetical protein